MVLIPLVLIPLLLIALVLIALVLIPLVPIPLVLIALVLIAPVLIALCACIAHKLAPAEKNSTDISARSAAFCISVSNLSF